MSYRTWKRKVNPWRNAIFRHAGIMQGLGAFSSFLNDLNGAMRRLRMTLQEINEHEREKL